MWSTAKRFSTDLAIHVLDIWDNPLQFSYPFCYSYPV
jgi:hypothetical protein